MKLRYKLLFTFVGGLLLTAGIATESGVNVALSNAFESKTTALNASNAELKGQATISEFKLNNTNWFWVKMVGTDYPDVDGQGNFTFTGTQAKVVMDNYGTNFLLYDADGNKLEYSLSDMANCVTIDQWTSHPYFNIQPTFSGGKTISDVAKVEIKKGFKIPSYDYYTTLNTTPAPSYYEIRENYVATKVGDSWNLIESDLKKIGNVALSKANLACAAANYTFLDLGLKGSDYPDVDGTSAIKLDAAKMAQINNWSTHIELYDSSNNRLPITICNDMYANFQTYHPFFDLRLGGIEGASKIVVKKGLKIPSYAYVTDDTASEKYGYYELGIDYTISGGTIPTTGGQRATDWTVTSGTPEVVKRNITNIHVRNGGSMGEYNNLYILLFLDECDYTGGNYTGDRSFLDYITVYVSGYKKYTLAQLYRNHIAFRHWDANSLGIAINGSDEVNANTIEYVSIDSDCKLPSELGLQLYEVGPRNLYNNGYNTAQVGWSTSFAVKDNCHTITYKNADSSADIGYQMAQKDSQVNLMPNPITPEPGHIAIWKLDGEEFTGTMPNKDIVLVPDTVTITKTNTAVTNLHIRTDGNGVTYALFFLETQDYGGTDHNVPCTNLGASNFKDNVYFFVNGSKIKLADIVHESNDYQFNIWTESKCFAVRIDTDQVSGLNTDSVYFANDCTFPSKENPNRQLYGITADTDYFNLNKSSFAVSFVKKENCHTLTYLNTDTTLYKVYRAANEEVTAISVPDLEEGYYGYWKDAEENKIYANTNFTMPANDYTLTAFKGQIQNVNTELLNIDDSENTHYIQIRNNSGLTKCDQLFILFLLKDNDYTVANTPYTGDTTFTEDVTVHAVDDDYTLSDLLRHDAGEPIMFKKWGEANSIGFPIDGTKVNATTINSVEIKEGCVFPSMTGEKTYTLAPHEYFNKSFDQVGWSTLFSKAEQPVHNVTVDVAEKTYNYRGEEGTTITLPTIPVDEGYHINWVSEDVEISSDNQFVMPVKDVEILGTIAVTTYSITYDGIEGASWETGNHPTEYTVETPDVALSNLTKEGYEFLGWTCEGLGIQEPTKDVIIETGTTGNLVLTANWKVITHIVTFDSDGGTHVASVTVNHGEKLTKPADPTKEGVTFLGWYLGENEFNFDTPITSALTLKAKWGVTCNVTFDSDGGSSVQSQTVIKGGKVTEPTAPTKEGYTFEGWFNGDTKWDFNNTINEDITLKAHWKKKGGCGGSIIAGGTITGIAALGGALLLVLKKKKKEE